MLQAPNSKALEAAFRSTGLELSTFEDECLQLRNVALHGNTAMEDSELISAKTEEHRIGVLRTLIFKAILKLISYDGPYCDYGLVPLQCTIQKLESQ